MTDTPTGAPAPSIIERVQNIILKPQSEWDRIDGEQANVQQLYTGYALPLIAIAAVCGFIGMSVFGVSGFGISYRVPMVTGVVSAIIQIVMGLVGIYVLALITNALAPNFGSQQNMGQAHKLAVYGSTASFLAGVFAIFPPLAMLGILGLYSLVLLYLGLPRLMKTPEDKRIGYFATIIIASIVLWIVIGVIVGAVQGAVGGNPMGRMGGFSMNQNAPVISAESTAPQGEVTLPGGGTLDIGELEKMGQAMANGDTAQTADPALLAQRLPASLPGGFALETSSNGAAMGVANAEAVYANGGARITLTVTDMGAMGAMAAIAGAANVQQNSTSADGYSRTQTVNGRVVTEEVNGDSAKYGVVGRGVAIMADGAGGASIDQVRAAVNAINIEQLERDFGA
ncbi:MAG: DUF1282 family protein [Hyphomonadaceae bacterium]|nr:DUF1282 family protein [Hyphomonadaceae bacterium]